MPTNPISFRGAYTAITTPFTSDAHAIDFGLLREQITFQAQGGVTGIVVSGTTGESPTLSESEYRSLVTKAVDIGHSLGIQVIAGTGSNSTHHAIEQHKFARSVGADASLSVNPYYNKPVQDGLYAHFAAIADSCDLPVMLYNIPGRTGVALTPETVERIAKHPNIRAIKEATGSTDSASEICSRSPHLALLSGDDSMTLPFASVGGVGVVSVISNLVPDRVSALCAAINRHDLPGALAIHRELFALCRVMFVETNPIPVKAAMKLLGRDSGALRLPMTQASPATLKQLQGVLSKFPSAQPGVLAR
jgi:4-hydroxy-tetrahydrodipicolinate synthase